MSLCTHRWRRLNIASYSLSDRALAEWLLDHGADPNARAHFDITPLSVAAQSAPLDVIKLLFARGASAHKGTPLHHAVRHQRSNDVIEFFIEQGAPINDLQYCTDELTWNHFAMVLPLGTALHEAARVKSERIVELLLRHGADPKISDSFGNYPETRDTSKL